MAIRIILGSTAFHRFLLPLLVAFCAGCSAPGPGMPAPPIAYATQQPYGRTITPVNLKSLPQTIGIEHQDRVARFARLAALYGVAPPKIDQMQLPAGTIKGVNYGIPVVRVQFQERVFFDFNKDTLRPDAGRVLDLLADSMRRDVPDAKVTILGHTDAIGGDTYNIDLSKRRALAVTQELVRRGVRPDQLSMVAIGKNQPIAPNTTDEGRGLNRRVEFMISASQDANRALVQHRRIYREYLATTEGEPPPFVPNKVVVSIFNFTINSVNSTDDTQRAHAQPSEGDTRQANRDDPSRSDTRQANRDDPSGGDTRQASRDDPSAKTATKDQEDVDTPPAQLTVTPHSVAEIPLQKPEDMAFNVKRPEGVNVRSLDEEFKPFETPPGS
jgi:outer membrane protein OmpA-like peptidoglycan-associated protein